MVLFKIIIQGCLIRLFIIYAKKCFRLIFGNWIAVRFMFARLSCCLLVTQSVSVTAMTHISSGNI